MRTIIALLALLGTTGAATSASFQDELRVLEETATEGNSREKRVDALEKIAALQSGKAPSPEVTKALVQGLKDEDPIVRSRTIELLDAAQHPETTVAHLSKAADAELKRWKSAANAYACFNTSKEGKRLLKRVESESRQGLSRPTARGEYVGRRAELREAEEALAPVLDACCKQLGNWRDDRSVRALAKILKELSEEKTAKSDQCKVATARLMLPFQALLQQGSKDSLNAAVDALLTWAARGKKSHAEAERDRKKSKRNSEIPDLTLGLKSLSITIANSQLYGELLQFAVDHKLSKPPSIEDSSSKWHNWAKEAKTKLPNELGRVEAPVRED